MNKLLSILLIFALGCVPEKSAPTEFNNSDNNIVTSEAIQWIKDNAHILDDIDLSDGYADLLPLKSIIGNSKIVAIGEMTYGTHECQSMKLRLIDFLVKEMDYNIVCMDLPYPESADINQFINTSVGDIDNILYDTIFWRWWFPKPRVKYNKTFYYSQEVIDIIKWTQIYNRDFNAQVCFYGMGILKPHRAMTNVVNYLYSIDTTIASYVDSLYLGFQIWAHGYPFINSGIKANNRKNINTVLDTLESQRNNYISLSSTEEYEHALFFAQFVVNAEKTLFINNENTRDEYRLDLVNYILDQAGTNSKMVLLGYNNQIGNFNGNLGNLFKNEFNQDFFNIGFTISSGYFYARILNPDDGSYSKPCIIDLPSVPENSYEGYFQKTEIPYFYLDVKSNLNPPGSASTDWLYGPREMKNIDMFYEPDNPEKYYKSLSLESAFDLMIYIEETSKSELKLIF